MKRSVWRDESTPDRKKLWQDIKKAASRAPSGPRTEGRKASIPARTGGASGQ